MVLILKWPKYIIFLSGYEFLYLVTAMYSYLGMIFFIFSGHNVLLSEHGFPACS